MMRTWFFVLVLAGVMLWAPAPALSVATVQAGAFSRVITAEIQGLVFYSDGETPAADLPVRIWDIEKREFIYETRTDENGFYKLPKLEPGRYYVTFDWMKLELLVVEEKETALTQQPHDVIVVIPRGVGFVSLTQLSTFLLASTMSQYSFEERPRIVSP
ncbi:MAG: hypothetical protein V1873_05300 [Verrucomicrobiota bacterium]